MNNSQLHIRVLGSGTSQGVPVVGCRCDTCISTDRRDKRLRSGLVIRSDRTSVIIDTGPDLRQQLLTHEVPRIDGILYTHEHNDHIIGLDDIRPYNFAQKEVLHLYAMSRVADELQSRFAYIFAPNQYPGAPKAEMHHIVEDEVIRIGDIDFQPVPIMHGNLPILGYRVGDFAFITDASWISDRSFELLSGTKTLIINALQKRDHHSHFTLDQALESIDRVSPDRAYITHLSHRMGPTVDWERQLPQGVFTAYDGLELWV